MNPQDKQPESNQEPLVTGSQPDVPPVQPATAPSHSPQPGVQASNQAAEQTDTFGIISIVLAFVGMQVVGLILGIIGNNKAKKEGYSNKLSKIGIILNAVFMVLGIILFIGLIALGFWGAQQTSQNIEFNSDVFPQESVEYFE